MGQTGTTGYPGLIERLARIETASIYEHRTVTDLKARVRTLELRAMKAVAPQKPYSIDSSGWVKVALALVLPIVAAISALMVTGDMQRAAEAASMFSVP